MARKKETPVPEIPPQAAPESDDLSRAIRIAGQFIIGGFITAGLLLLIGEILFGGSFLIWIVRFLALLAFIVVATLWRQRIKFVYLSGEEDIWYQLLAWNHRLIGFVPAGMVRITPLQFTRRWRQVTPIFIKEDVQARNKIYDQFTVHIRVRFMVDPDIPVWEDARWLITQYPDGIAGMARGMIGDLVTREIRQLESFSVVTEEETERNLKALINEKFVFLEAKGVLIDTAATFVDIMVPDALIQEQLKTRAEFSSIQIIRDIAHDMGMTTDELLLQRALEKVQPSRSQKSHREIVSVLQMLRNQRLQEEQERMQQEAAASMPQIPSHTPAPDDPEEVITREDIQIVEEENAVPPDRFEEDDEGVDGPRGYVEGIYEPIDDDNDPDSDSTGPRGIYSPF